MKRFLKIAWREYLAYVRTFGFWLSLLLFPLGLSMIGLAPMAVERSAPIPLVTVVDFTGKGVGPQIEQALAAHAPGAKPVGLLAAPPGAPFKDPADATARLKPFLAGATTLPGGGRLDTAVILYPVGDTLGVDVWSRDVANQRVRDDVARTAEDALRRAKLEARGVNPGALAAIDALQPRITEFSPTAASGQVSLKDRLPGFIGLGMGILLWMVVLTGAGMLLNSVMEEKTSRILEVLLTSASVPEIMAGKILGVAAVTATVLTLWMTIGGILLATRMPGTAADVAGILLSHWRLAYFALYFLGGYTMFATLYVTIGAFCETAREAQTLLSPMMIIMSVPLLFMSQAVTHPGAPLLAILTWIPLFTPFLMAARVASDPPLWEIAATAAVMFGVTALELWVAIPAFKTGALAAGRFDIRGFAAALVRRAEP
jgi:ABC-2 type transport system permease protein